MSEEEIIEYVKEIIEDSNNEIKGKDYFEYIMTSNDIQAIQGLLDLYQKEKEELEYYKENDYAWHQLYKMGNKREYRSKFLKEFQVENGENVFPDYDEIYKRYDEEKEKNKKLQKFIKKYFGDINKEFKGLLNHKFIDFISKDKIRKEIEEQKNMKVEGRVFTHSVSYAIKVLESLLEE